MNLREEIEAYHREHFDDTPEWTAKVILKMIEKRIDIRIEELKKGLNDKYWKNILGKEKWARYSKSLQDLIDELEMLKMVRLK